MAEAAIGARIMFCGHDGWFTGDIFKIGDVNVISCGEPICADRLVRGANHEATHVVIDFPRSGYWRPDRGVLVVPAAQCRVLDAK